MAPPGSSVLSAASHVPAPPARARPQARKRANPQGNDDAAYHGALPSSSAGAKRAAGDKAEGEPRVKRKRLEPAVPAASSSVAAGASRKPNDKMQEGERQSLVRSLVYGRVAHSSAVATRMFARPHSMRFDARLTRLLRSTSRSYLSNWCTNTLFTLT